MSRGTQEKLAPEDRPAVENYPELEHWLDRIYAERVWQARLDTKTTKGAPDPLASVEGWFCNGKLVVIVIQAKKLGWAVYTSSKEFVAEKILEEVEARVGLDREPDDEC